MDSNGTRFHLLLGRPDWEAGGLPDGSPVFGANSPLAWDDSNSELTLSARVLEFPSSAKNAAVTLSQRRDAAADRFGNWYWIADGSDQILVQSSGSTLTTPFWPGAADTSDAMGFGAFGDCVPEQPAALQFCGLTVTRDHYLVVGVLQPAGLLIFDLQHGGAPRQLAWPGSVPFQPYDLSPSRDGGFWILDRANHRLWKVDRTFAVVPANQPSVVLSAGGNDLFQPLDGSAVRQNPELRFPLGITLDAASPLAAANAVAIEALADGSVLILDSPAGASFSQIYRLVDGAPAGPPVSTQAVLEIVEQQSRPGFTLLGHDFAYLADDRSPSGQRFDIIYVVGASGDQAFSFALSLKNGVLGLKAIAEFLPLRLFGGKGIVAANHQVYYDFRDRWIPLVAQRRPRYQPEGELLTKRLDGKEPGCVWHRLLIDACLPPEAAIEVFTRAHDKPDVLPFQPWLPEPTLRVRGDGPEQPWAWQIARSTIKTSELLFQRAKGRYLEIRLRLTGNGRSSPRIRSLRAYYPRFSYLEHYVPAVYRQDAESASFVDRFLANFEGSYTVLEDKIAMVQALFDPRSAPPEALAWLANWFGVALDPAWSAPRRRMFLRHAITFFEARGTVPGLLMALRMVLEDCADESLFATPENTAIRIVERFRLRTTPAAVLGAPSEQTGLPLLPQTTNWDPSQGAEDLDRRYRAAFSLDPPARYPARASDLPAAVSLADWQVFSRNTLGFVPSYLASQAAAWQSFLASRYTTVQAAADAHHAAYTSFDSISLFTEVPKTPAATRDWYLFQAVVLRMQETAHRFIVYLPMRPQDAANPDLHRQKLELAQRVVELEKPAHTAYDLKFFWAAFRVGEARLGEGTTVDLGSRAPQLLRSMTLNSTGLGEGYLDAGTPCFPRQRPVLQQCGTSPSVKNCSCIEEENP